MNAPRIITTLSITLLLSWCPATFSMNQSPWTPNYNTNQQQPQTTTQAKQSPTASPTLQPSSPQQPQQLNQVVIQGQTQPTSTNTPETALTNQMQQLNVSSTAPTPQQPNQTPPTPTVQQELTLDISKLEKPEVYEKTDWTKKQWYAVDSVRNPKNYPATQAESNITKGINEIAKKVCDNFPVSTVSQPDLREKLNTLKPDITDLHEIIEKGHTNSQEFTERTLNQARQIVKFYETACVLNLLYEVAKECAGEHDKALKTYGILDKLRKAEQLNSPKFLTEQETKRQQGIETFQKTIIADLKSFEKKAETK